VGWRDGGTAIHRDGGTERTAAVEWRRRQRVEKHGGRWAVEWKGRTWVSVDLGEGGKGVDESDGKVNL